MRRLLKIATGLEEVDIFAAEFPELFRFCLPNAENEPTKSGDTLAVFLKFCPSNLLRSLSNTEKCNYHSTRTRQNVDSTTRRVYGFGPRVWFSNPRDRSVLSMRYAIQSLPRL